MPDQDAATPPTEAAYESHKSLRRSRKQFNSSFVSFGVRLRTVVQYDRSGLEGDGGSL